MDIGGVGLYVALGLVGVLAGAGSNTVFARYFGAGKKREATLKVLAETSGDSSATIALANLLEQPAQLLPSDRLTLDSIHIHNFKNIADLEVDLSGRSELGGNWTCIAGVNGAGKSSILQAICLVLLGERLIPEIGTERLRRMWRRTPKGDLPPELTLRCHVGNETHELFIAFSDEGVDRDKLAKRADYPAMSLIWRSLREQTVLSFGATRNLSDYRDMRYASFSRQVQRQMTLFDPLTQVANIEVLLQGGREMMPVLETAAALLAHVMPEPTLGKVRLDAGQVLRVLREGATLDALDLPDGFRSTIAWLVDLCAAWHQNADLRRGCDPTSIAGIVLIDEIDLHLHASLQRDLVPALRKALPNVQFIATTHSPLVLSSFDRRELVILDRDTDGGVRGLDRQLFGMSMDDIYQWLMGTQPSSPVIEELLRKADPNAALLLAQGSDTSEAEAETKLARRRSFLERVKNSVSATEE